MKFRTQFPDTPDYGSKEVFRQPSMTEPDNTMTIPEIIARYTRGQGLGVQARPWQQGVAQEDGEQVAPQDATLESVLGIQERPAAAAPEPTPAAAAEPALQAPAPGAPSAAPAPAPPAQPGAPAGA